MFNWLMRLLEAKRLQQLSSKYPRLAGMTDEQLDQAVFATDWSSYDGPDDYFAACEMRQLRCRH